jgi:hypothetical protein
MGKRRSHPADDLPFRNLTKWQCVNSCVFCATTQTSLFSLEPFEEEVSVVSIIVPCPREEDQTT